MNTSEVVQEFLSITSQLRIFHWQTESFAQHKAFGKAYDSLSDLSDKFIETMIGTYGRPTGVKSVAIVDLSDKALSAFLEETTSFLQGLTEEFDMMEDSDLLNIRDEILGVVNHLKYLLTLE